MALEPTSAREHQLRALGADSLSTLLADPRVLPVGATITTRSEGFAYSVEPVGGAAHHLVTAGGSLLRVLPERGNSFNVRAFGATVGVGLDNAPAIAAAIAAAGNLVTGAVYIPSGEYETRTAIDVSLGQCRGISILGDGPKSSIIKGAAGLFHTLLKITRTKKDQYLLVEKFGLLCDNNRTEVSQRFAGLYYTSTIDIDSVGAAPDADYGYGKRTNFTARDVFIGGYDINFPWRGRFQNGMYIEYGRWPQIVNCAIDSGCPWDDIQEFPTTYIEGSGLLFKDCYYGAAHNTRVSGRWRHGIRFVGTMLRPPPSAHQDFEGCVAYGCEIVGFPETGISVDHLGRPEDDPSMSLKEPGFFISSGHVHGHRTGIDLRHHSVATILDMNIETTNSIDAGAGGTRQNEAHIRLHDCHTVAIQNCQFLGTGYDTNDLDCTRGIEVSDKVNHVSVDACHFRHRGIGIVFLNGDTLNFVIGDANVWSGRAVGSDVYQPLGPRVRVQKRVEGAQVRIPRMGDQAQYDGQVSAKTFEGGAGLWTQAGGWPDIVTTVSGGMAPGYSHALRLRNTAYESRWVPDQLPNGATFKLTAVLRNANNPYAVNLGAQVRNAAGAITSRTKAVSAASAAGWQTVQAMVSFSSAECGGGWRPLIQMAGIGGTSNADCQVVYFDIELVRRQNEAFLPHSGLPLALSLGEMTFERISNTQIRIWMRGLDDTLRSTLLNLS